MTRDAKATGLCRKHGFSDATFYKWKARHGGLEGAGAKRLKALEDEKRPPETSSGGCYSE
ncbi:transposase [Komagataeibacter swingsii]|uniref:Transposase n=1 Tax=Komagataeibacter swingsii TaxID=215220 RepID=A0A850NWN2_9PROT|nr:transposase [Komagataeibacter swingsii]